MQPMLALKNVTHTCGTVNVLRDASLQINPKDAICITGDSGSGKTTILRLLLRLDAPTKGTVLIDGVNLAIVPAPVLQLYRRRTGIIFQEPVLLKHATITENIALPLELSGIPPATITRAVTDLLQRFGLRDVADRFPETLSQSERSLVAIARAIVTAPMVLLADEPFANLDPAQSAIVAELIRTLHANGTTIIALSRSEETARLLEARIVHLKNSVLTEENKQNPGSDSSRHRILERPTASTSSSDASDANMNGPKGRKIRVTAIHSESVIDNT